MLHGKLPVQRAVRLHLRGRERGAQVTAEGVGGDDGEALPRRDALRTHRAERRVCRGAYRGLDCATQAVSSAGGAGFCRRVSHGPRRAGGCEAATLTCV